MPTPASKATRCSKLKTSVILSSASRVFSPMVTRLLTDFNDLTIAPPNFSLFETFGQSSLAEQRGGTLLFLFHLSRDDRKYIHFRSYFIMQCNTIYIQYIIIRDGASCSKGPRNFSYFFFFCIVKS